MPQMKLAIQLSRPCSIRLGVRGLVGRRTTGPSAPARDRPRHHRVSWPVESEDLPPYGLREVDEHELTAVEQVVLSALIDDSDETVLRGPRVGDDSIDLSEDQ